MILGRANTVWLVSIEMTSKLLAHVRPVVNEIKNILVVSPYLSVLNASEKALRAAGYTVTCTYNMTGAFRYLFRHAVDLVIVCSSLDEQQRRFMLREIRQRWSLPIVFLPPGKPDAVEQLFSELAAPHDRGNAA